MFARSLYAGTMIDTGLVIGGPHRQRGLRRRFACFSATVTISSRRAITSRPTPSRIHCRTATTVSDAETAPSKKRPATLSTVLAGWLAGGRPADADTVA